MPPEYRNSTEEYIAFLRDAIEFSDLTTLNQAYTMVQGVFQAFRRRLTIKESIAFANTLPVNLRALYIADWDLENEPVAFGSRDEMTREVQNLRRDHNFAPAHSILAVAKALRLHVDEKKFDRLLRSLSEGAIDFWSVA